MTNREWLESLSDEELAKIFLKILDADDESIFCHCDILCSIFNKEYEFCPTSFMYCKDCIADILQAEHEVEK